jgi:hypothetical protein
MYVLAEMRDISLPWNCSLSIAAMTQAKLAADSPKVFQALARFLSAEDLAIVANDYTHADAYGGNREPRLTRGEGVSFNPRLARILSILVHDVGVRELTTIRAALYVAAVDAGLGGADGAEKMYATIPVPPDLVSTVNAEAAESNAYRAKDTIRAVIALDSVRHLHQGRWSTSERSGILANAEQTLQNLTATKHAPELILKLRHAIELQRRRL